MKIRRNAPCPCGSGKKYKHCCMNKAGQSNAIPWPTFPENYVIRRLLEASERFRAFYGAERGKIREVVYWARDSALPDGIDYRSTKLPTGESVIRLRRIPALLADAMKIAHELEHFVFDAEGFPVTGAKPQHEVISSSLNSMIHDPLVNSRLKTYGFDCWEDYETELNETFRQLGQVPTSPSQHLVQTRWFFNYVGKILDWEVTFERARKSENEFKLWFDARYPDIAAEAQKLLALIKDIGYDTPERQRHLFSEIIKMYNLGGIVFL